MFICCDNCLFNSDNISFVRVNEKDIIIGLTSTNYLLKYKNEVFELPLMDISSYNQLH